jgi:hypothetical protein
MGDGTQTPVPGSPIAHRADCSCVVCKEVAGRRSARSGSLSRARVVTPRHELESQIEGFKLLVYMLLLDRGGAAVFSKEEVIAAQDDVKSGRQIVSEIQPDSEDYVIKIVSK